MATPKPKPNLGTNPKPKLTSTFTPEQLEYYKSVKAQQKLIEDRTKAVEKQRKEEARGQEKLARQKAAAERAYEDEQRKKIVKQYRASR
jgi:hypothetical protein